ncbi:MAG: hypothetical protein GC154_21670, partial [bacterium]|nr:hypothetical protein [bacterium]
MRKSFADLLGVKSLFLFLFAVAALMGVGSASAQNMSFKNVPLSLSANGVAGATTVTGGAVLAGNDTVSPVLSSTSDGYIDPATGAGKYLKDVVGIAPILANIRSDASNGESYALMSVVVGVTQQLVSDVKAGDATAIAEAKALVSATFDVAMLTSAGSVPEASNVVPTSVAGIGSATYGIEVPANATDVLVFTWSNLSWLKAQNPQDSVAQQNTLKATVKFVNAATQTTSNYVGLETKSSGPWVVTNGFVDGDNKTKDLFVRYAGLTNASADVSIPSPTVDEFRTADTLTVYSLITAREDYDGEPDAYFGASSDKIVFSATTGKGDGQTGGQGMSVLYNITYPGGTAIPSTVSSTYTKAASGSDLIVALTGTILNTVITNGAYQNLSMSFTATDDVGNASSSSNNGYRVDSQPPTVLNVSVYTEGSLGKNSSWPWFGAGKIGTKNTAYDTVKIDITVHPEGENTVFGIDPAAPWADISIKPTADDGDSTNPSWTTTTEVKGNSGFASVELVSAAVQTTSFPDTFNNVDAASFTAQMTNDVVANVTKAGFIFSISDNARNNAVLKTGGTVFATTGSLTTTRSGADNPIDAATFVVDNAAPVVLGATIYASGLPSDFLNGDSTSGLFDQLKAVSETVNAISNAFAISATDIRLVTRIAPQSATDGYKGMEVSVDVSFMPASSTPAEVDWKFSGKNADAVSYFNALYIPSVTTENYLADMAGTAVPSLLVEPTSSSAQGNNWSLVSAGFDGANSATAIFKLVNGITYTPSVLTDSIASVTGFARIADKNFNVENTGSLNTTNTFALDTVGPKADQISDPAYISGWQQSTLIKGNGSTANTVFLVTDAGSGYSFTQAFGELSVVGDSSIGGGTTANFKNAYYAATPSVNQVSAGNLIIFAVTFQENDTIGGYRDNDYTPNLFVYFPYVFQGGSKSDLSSSDNIVVPGETFANKLIGKNFKTMSLDFSEFISTSKNLLPDVTSAQSGSKNVTAAAQADIIYATWYLYIDPNNSNLVTNTAVDKIRYITAYSRDLSGNKSQYGFPVGKADFQVPIAAIQSWNIAQPRRSTPVSATSIAGAKTISAATISKAATSQIIVKLTNGPFDPTTFSAGTSNKSLVSLKLRDKANPGTSYGSTGPSSLTFDGVQSVTSGSKIAYATFDIDFSNTSIWSLGTQVVPAVEFIATVTSATGTIGTSISTDTQLDSNPPAVDAVLREGTVVTGDTVETSAPFYVRPGQVLILDVTVTSDTYEDVAGIISQFGLSGNYKNFTNPVTDNIQQISSSSVRKSANTYYYNTTFTVPTSNNSGVNTADVIVSVTDMAGNNTSTSNPAGANRFRIETAKPSIDNVNLSAKADFDRTGAGGTEGSYYLVRQTVYNGKNNVLNLLTTFKPNAVVGSGDIVRVTAEIQPNDPVFTTSDKFTYTGDFSQIGFSKTQAASSSSQLLGPIYATWE